MIYYIGAFFVGLGAILISGAVLFGFFVAADAIIAVVNRKCGWKLICPDLMLIPISIFICYAIGNAIISRFWAIR